ncbi:centrosomal protein of 152 kDa isoform X2 [Silurus meridionalis]|uniref:centrosomal protein of 152 kDa isoform X2 n=1 Tax=Silurus meridionalis TaxID=175797 RepID=UPI001EEB3958|nr:centrosomal protein of 152 kDa isoform X2 [Silurus meridionalis]XP_046715992.1 centrosomal protein of 152 kDa isoform X2 [Silurus meridionalis]
MHESVFACEATVEDVRLIQDSLLRLHKLLTDLPDDMLEDSHDYSPELDYSTCSPQKDHDRPQHAWNGQSDQPQPPSAETNPGDAYNQSDHQGYMYRHGHFHQLQGRPEHLTHGWDSQQGHQYESGDYAYSSTGTVESNATTNFSVEEDYEQEPYPHTGHHPGADGQDYEEHASIRNHFQKFDNGIAGDQDVDCYKASYQPHKPARQPDMFNIQASHQNGHFDQLQKDFLDSSPSTVDAQEYAQVKILNKAQLRQIEDLEQKLEDSRRKMRYLEHQFAIVKDEKDGLMLSLKESSHLLEEAKECESRLQGKVLSLERQIQTLTERDHENMKKLCAAEAAVDSLQQQMMELCRSDTLTRAREQHDRDMVAMREQHEAKVLGLQQKLDTHSQNLEEQVQAAQRLREQVRQLERQREEEQVDRAAVINALTQRLEESQQQCAKLLQTGCVQEMSQMQIKLQQAQSSRNISENMNKALQEELNELKEQITLYESAVKFGAVSFDSNPNWTNQLSESYVDLGIKKVNWKDGRNHSTPVLSDSSLPKEDLIKELKTELQRCLAQLKAKREKISRLQKELQTSQNHVEQLQTQLQGAERNVKDFVVRESSLEKLLEQSNTTPHKEVARLEEERQQLQKRVEVLELRNKDLKQSEEKVKAANSELCTKMREMIQELDQEKQEAEERYERTQQQYRDDVVQRVRVELDQEHADHIEQLTAQHQQHIQQLESKLAELSQEVLAVQECYISVCKEKDKLEENLQTQINEERKQKDSEVKRRQEVEEAQEKLKADFASQHQEAFAQLKAQWTKDKETEIQLHVTKQLASAKKSWQEGQQELEKTWEQKLEEALKEKQKAKSTETHDGSCQTESVDSVTRLFSLEQLEDRLSAQRMALQQESDSKLTKAVEEAVKGKERELQQKHVQDMALQIECAVSRAWNRWLHEMSSLPEYSASLQTEREKWETLKEQQIEKRVTLEVKAADDKWLEMMSRKCKELEDYVHRNQELQEQLNSLNNRLKDSTEEQKTVLKSELSAARALWNTEKQKEISCLKMQLQGDHESLKEQLERRIKETQEEVHRQGQKHLQEAMWSKEQEWRSQQQLKLREAQQQLIEEVLTELKEVLNEVQEQREVNEERERRESGVSARLRSLCKEALARVVANTKQELVKSSEEKLRHVLKETQEQHEKELDQIRTSLVQRKESVCHNMSCNDTIGKLQNKNRELQRHLEKACRQLQHTVREHKSAMHKLKEEHEEILQKEKESHAKAVQQAKLSACKESGDSVSQQDLHAGLEEMNQQYMKAVHKIRGDMLRYLHESKERAAELIRAEVLRERQDTARRMRRYYLTCLQELLEEGGQTTGAEKKIINAASKLAAMAKVLETPVVKKKLHRNPDGQDPSSNSTEDSKVDHLAKVSGAPSSQSRSTVTVSHKVCRNEQRQQMKVLTETSSAAQTDKIKTAGKASQPDFKSVKTNAAKVPDVPEPVTPHSLHSHHPKSFRDFASSSAHFSSVGSVNVTLRKQSREEYLTGTETGKASERLTPQVADEPFLVEEAPVRDDGQSDWSLSSNGSIFINNIHLTSSHPGKHPEPVKSFSLTGPTLDDLDFGSTAGDNSDVTVYKEIVKKPSKKYTGIKLTKTREPIPGSEDEAIRKTCTKSLLPQFRICQQDSGFDSPASLIQK